MDIRTLKEQKSPKTASEMAALVAYYVSELAPLSERKNEIGTGDIERYSLKMAPFALPANPRYTLANAKNAGYLDNVGSGRYSLNPVGYNLVVHRMGTGEDKSSEPRRRAPAKRRWKRQRRKQPIRRNDSLLLEAEAWRRWWRQLDALKASIARLSTNVSSVPVRDKAREVVQFYFRQVRGQLEALGIELEKIVEIDQKMQHMIELATGVNRKSTYLGIIRALSALRAPLTTTIEIEQILGRPHHHRYCCLKSRRPFSRLSTKSFP